MSPTQQSADSSFAGTIKEVVNGVTYHYQTGFGNELSSEVVPGALPVGRNTPRHVPYNLYTEQLSGTAFTAPRATNKRTWLYRIQPSVAATAVQEGGDATTVDHQRLRKYFGGCPPVDCVPTADPCRWHPRPPPVAVENNAATLPCDFVHSVKLVCHAGDPAAKHGLAIYQYSGVTEHMNDTHMVNADGDFLVVPSQGTLQINTELGRMTVAPTEIAVIPRGMVFQVNLVPDSSGSSDTTGALGYMLEIYSSIGFQLPELGPIGSNGLANARDFLFPVAWFATANPDDYKMPCEIVTKLHSELFARKLDHSPYNVLAWHGNYLPYKYALKRFCAVGSVTYDHLDPSLYTVLTCPSGTAAGTALADFVIFPPRVMATDANTLRPPWFHRNIMSEYMGLIYGRYDAKNEGFQPGGASLHNCMTPHGPDTESYAKAVENPCDTPVHFDGGMAFMFETCLSLSVSPEALNDPVWREMRYARCWQGLSASKFTGWHLLKEKVDES